MQTVTAKEAKNRLGQVIDLALAEKAVAISKNGREAVVLVSAEYFRELSGVQGNSAEYFRELSGVQGFIQDTYAAEKNKSRTQFAKEVSQGRAKSTDASMFKGMKSAVKFKNEEF
jgi:prevent-host-death family protein